CRRFYPRSGGGTCGQCGGSARTATMVLPLYGFVAGKPTKRGLGDERPRRLWASEVYFFEHSGEPGPLSTLYAMGGATVAGRFSRNGWLAVVNTGSAGKGFGYCAACGYAWPNGARAEGRGGTARSRHSKPGGRFQCGGQMVTRHFGHKFATDMAEFVLSGLTHATEAEVRSVQAALEEGAARVLNVPRGELGSLFYYDGLDPVFVLYDNVPGGAGLARSAHGRAEEVLSEAYRVTQCDSCGPGSSCYRCLRTYGNQHYHEELNRTAASSYLAAFANG
uniref:DUF1998 domain-containing protein n=1 Tax=Tepidiforma sp. TaxID=2682230 RepID=UPI002ADDD3C8